MQVRDTGSQESECDVLVFGSGIPGLSAALFAAKAGMSVILCEKEAQVGGTSSTSGGALYVPLTRHAKDAGVTDSREAVLEYLRAEIGNRYDADLIEAYVDSGAEALEELQRDTAVQLDVLPWPDYHPDQPGAVAFGRSLRPLPFDGRLLGRDFERVRPPLTSLMILGGMSLGQEEIAQFLKPFASFANMKHIFTRLIRHARDRMRYSRGTELNNGNALVAQLYFSLRDMPNVQIAFETPLVSLIVEHGRVVGARVRDKAHEREIRARSGVILATGGFPASREMRERYGRDFPHENTFGAGGNVGDGINAALAAGGKIETEVASPMLWTPGSTDYRRDGSPETVMYGYLDRGRPGVIAVDSSGRRFVNESDSYHDIVMAMYRKGYAKGERFWFICDRDFVRKHGLGKILPRLPSLRRYVRSGYITMAKTIPELASKIGANPRNLLNTVRRNNFFAKTGYDPEFNRGGNIYNRQFGEPGHGNPNLGPIEHGPFIALPIIATSLGTTAGLRTSRDGQALRTDRSPIMGLYACGNEMVSLMRGAYPGGGVTLGPGIVFAYRAVRHIVQAAGMAEDCERA